MCVVRVALSLMRLIAMGRRTFAGLMTRADCPVGTVENYDLVPGDWNISLTPIVFVKFAVWLCDVG